MVHRLHMTKRMVPLDSSRQGAVEATRKHGSGPVDGSHIVSRHQATLVPLLGRESVLSRKKIRRVRVWNDIGGHDIPSGPGAFHESRDVVVTCADGIEAQKPFQN